MKLLQAMRINLLKRHAPTATAFIRQTNAAAATATTTATTAKHESSSSSRPSLLLAAFASVAALGMGTALTTTADVASAEFTEHTDRHGRKYTYDTIKRKIVSRPPDRHNNSVVNIPLQKKLQSNIVLSDSHRVALCEWPLDQCKHNGEVRTSSPHNLFTHVKESGYDGVELTVGYFAAKFFKNCSRDEVARRAKEAAERYNMKIFGSNIWWVYDYPEMQWKDQLESLKEETRLTKLMGGEYVTFQLWLKDKYLNSSENYNQDEEYLENCAERIEDLQQMCWNQGMNCYIETHIQRISEDPVAFSKILDKVKTPTVETNGDLSHYLYRNFKNDSPSMKNIFQRMGHTHQRMCRVYGDLSANVEDPEQDWLSMGLTWKAFLYSLPGLKNGLSSRVICGESGPWGKVTDPLTLDAQLVPLYRAMAKFADKSAKGEKQEVINIPSDMNPFK